MYRQPAERMSILSVMVDKLKDVARQAAAGIARQEGPCAPPPPSSDISSARPARFPEDRRPNSWLISRDMNSIAMAIGVFGISQSVALKSPLLDSSEVSKVRLCCLLRWVLRSTNGCATLSRELDGCGGDHSTHRRHLVISPDLHPSLALLFLLSLSTHPQSTLD